MKTSTKGSVFKSFPLVVAVEDYHEFASIQEMLNVYFLNKYVKFDELGMVDRCYIGVYYFKKPTKTELSKVLKAAPYGITTDKDVKDFLSYHEWPVDETLYDEVE